MSLAVDVFAAFVTGFANTAVNGAIAAFVARQFTTGRTAKVAGFCVALGYAAGRFGYSGPGVGAAAVALGGLAGAATALAGLWFWLLRKPQPE